MKKLLAATVSALMLTASPVAFAKSNCAAPDEFQALNARVLQSDLMVGALACKQQASYNAFVKKFQPELVRRSNGMQSYFKRVYGGASTNQMNRFVTNIANDSSTTSLNMNESQFCSTIKQAFSTILSSDTRNLNTLISDNFYSSRHGVESCKSVAQN
jgi:hypothetical protein